MLIFRFLCWDSQNQVSTLAESLLNVNNTSSQKKKNMLFELQDSFFSKTIAVMQIWEKWEKQIIFLINWFQSNSKYATNHSQSLFAFLEGQLFQKP